MQEELNEFERNQVCDLVDKPEEAKPINTKWVFKNKLDEEGVIDATPTRHAVVTVTARWFNSQDFSKISKKGLYFQTST